MIPTPSFKWLATLVIPLSLIMSYSFNGMPYYFFLFTGILNYYFIATLEWQYKKFKGVRD